MWTLFLARLDRMAGKAANGNVIAERYIPDMLTEACGYRIDALIGCDIERYDKWCAAIDRLLDQWLIQRPELRWPATN